VFIPRPPGALQIPYPLPSLPNWRIQRRTGTCDTPPPVVTCNSSNQGPSSNERASPAFPTSTVPPAAAISPSHVLNGSASLETTPAETPPPLMAPFVKSLLAFAATNGYFIRNFEFEHAPPPEIKSKLKDVGLAKSEIDQSIFSGNGVFLILYIDSLLLIDNSQGGIDLADISRSHLHDRKVRSLRERPHRSTLGTPRYLSKPSRIRHARSWKTSSPTYADDVITHIVQDLISFQFFCLTNFIYDVYHLTPCMALHASFFCFYIADSSSQAFLSRLCDATQTSTLLAILWSSPCGGKKWLPY
jgi:hypothetical protein